MTFQPYDYHFHFQRPELVRIKWSQSWLPRHFYQHIYVPLVYCLVGLYNVSTKKRTIQQTGIHRNVYSLCKMVTLGQKLKMQKKPLKTFLQHIAVVLCKKKRFKKAANNRKTRPVSKWAKLATKKRL